MRRLRLKDRGHEHGCHCCRMADTAHSFTRKIVLEFRPAVA